METMTEQIWYYEKDGQPWGPLYRAEVEILISEGSIVENTPLWAEPMETWVSASEVEDFKQHFGGEVEPLVKAGSESHPWPRFFARMTDYFIFFGLTSIVRANIPADFPGASLSGIPALMIYPAVFTLIWVPLEALITKSDIGTFGQDLFGIKITDNEGNRPSYNQALSRAIDVWARGLGMGIPFLSVLTMTMSYNDLKKHSATAWDNDNGTNVIYTGVKYKKIAMIVLAVIIFTAVVDYVRNIF